MAISADRAGQRVVVLLTAVLAVSLAAVVLAYSRRAPEERTRPWPVLVLAAGAVLALAGLGVISAVASILEESP